MSVLSSTQLASVLVAKSTLELQERAVPVPGPGEVRLKVAAVGVCGSDVHYFRHGAIGSAVVQYPTLLGHEPSGVIDAVGPGVSLVLGQRVAVEPAMPCGDCEHCHSGRANICPAVRFLGTPPHDGIFCQYRLMPAACCLPIPDNLSLVEAALLEPLGVGLHAVELTRVRPGETVAIFGAGPIGLVTLLAARLAGAARIYMTDKVPERLEMALKLGADGVMDVSHADPQVWIKEQTEGRGVDVTFEAVGVQDSLNDAIQGVRIGGRMALIGIPSVPELTIPMHDCRRKELQMIHVRRSNNEVERCLPLVASGRLNLKPLATHYFSLADAPQAFQMVEQYADGVIRAMILPNGELERA